jgi:hypothetical protein
MRTKIFYLDRYKLEEEQSLREAGFETERRDVKEFFKDPGQPRVDKVPVLFRGPRLSVNDYEHLCKVAEGVGLRSMTRPDSYRIAEDFALHYPLLRDRSPAAVVVKASTDGAKILGRIEEGCLRYPIFVRSEVESAAKYVGADGCILRSPSLEEVRIVLRNLEVHVKGYRDIILKEMLPIMKWTGSSQSVEYRAVGLFGRLVMFDYEAGPLSLPAPEVFNLHSFANQCFESLSHGGCDGALFLDIGVTEDERPIVVECKNFLNGTIAHPRAVARQIAGLSIAPGA